VKSTYSTVNEERQKCSREQASDTTVAKGRLNLCSSEEEIALGRNPKAAAEAVAKLDVTAPCSKLHQAFKSVNLLISIAI